MAKPKGQDVRQQSMVFGEVADMYHRVRPSYPAGVVDDAISFCGVEAPRIVEVGAGTGKALVLFAARGLEIVALEPSPEMARVAESNCARYPGVRIIKSSFENWDAGSQTFDLLISAQAWHWIPLERRYVKARDVLRRNGAIAVFWNRPLWADSALCQITDDIYQRHAPGMTARVPGFSRYARAEDEEMRMEIDRSGAFARVTARTHRWSASYTAQDFIDLLATQSDHRMLEPGQLEALLGSIAEAIEGAGGRVNLAYETTLLLARGRP